MRIQLHSIALASIGLMCIISFLSIAYISTQSHESVHEQINNQFGLRSSIVYGPLGIDGITTAYLNGTADIEKYNQAKIYHIWNEIIGYNVNLLEMTMILSALMISLAIMMSKAVK